MVRFVAPLVLTCAIASGSAYAQIVNVQTALGKQPEADGAIGQLELKLDWREGNNQLLDLGATASVIVKRGRLLALAIARGELGRGRDDTLASSMPATARCFTGRRSTRRAPRSSVPMPR